MKNKGLFVASLMFGVFVLATVVTPFAGITASAEALFTSTPVAELLSNGGNGNGDENGNAGGGGNPVEPPIAEGDTNHKSWICHSTGSAKNPWVLIPPDDHSWNAHKKHDDVYLEDYTDPKVKPSEKECGDAPEEPTPVPPTPVPPTPVQPTPTEVPPTKVPPTRIPPE
ncbi:MAG: hypothetical protein UU77_C0058G0001, partial [candidate division WWE3 bacterium GW2011_GWC1_41_7]